MNWLAIECEAYARAIKKVLGKVVKMCWVFGLNIELITHYFSTKFYFIHKVSFLANLLLAKKIKEFSRI